MFKKILYSFLLLPTLILAQNIQTVGEPGDVLQQGVVSITDSAKVGTSSVIWVRTLFYNAADSSIGMTFYNLTLSRPDTVYFFQQDKSGGGGAGDIESVTANAPLSGGGESGAVTVSADTSVGVTKLATQGFVERKGYLTTETGDVESVTAGWGLTGGGNSGAVTLTADTTAGKLATHHDLIDSLNNYRVSQVVTIDSPFVGINDTSPTQALDVTGNAYVSGSMQVNTQLGVKISPNYNLDVYQASPTANQVLLNVGTSDDAARFQVDEDGDVFADGDVRGLQVVTSGSITTTGGTLMGNTISSYGGSANLKITSTVGNLVYTDRNFGVGTSVPGAMVEINGNKSSDTLLIVRNDIIARDSSFIVTPTGGGVFTGNVAIATNVDPTNELYVNGDLYVVDTLYSGAVVDHTAWPEDGVDVIRTIDGVDGKLDHATLPKSIQVAMKEERWKRKSDNYLMPREFSPVDSIWAEWYSIAYDTTYDTTYVEDEELGQLVKIDTTYHEGLVIHPANSHQDSVNYKGNFFKFTKIDTGRDVGAMLSLLTKSVQYEFTNSDSVKENWNFKTNTVKHDTLIIGEPDSTYNAPFVLSDGEAYSRMLPGDAMARVASSKNKKKDISDYIIDINKLKLVKPKKYKYTDGTQEHTGFIAEELNPALGITQTNEIDYNSVIVALWELVRQQQERIEALEKKVKP